MRILTLAIAGTLAACVAVSADAAKKRPSPAVSAAHSTCTGMKPQCLSDCYFAGAPPSQTCEVLLRNPAAAAGNFWCTPHGVNLSQLHQRIDPYCETICNFQLEQCMKTGFWEGGFFHRPAERRQVLMRCKWAISKQEEQNNKRRRT
jgi:hypothetical protein